MFKEETEEYIKMNKENICSKCNHEHTCASHHINNKSEIVCNAGACTCYKERSMKIIKINYFSSQNTGHLFIKCEFEDTEYNHVFGIISKYRSMHREEFDAESYVNILIDHGYKAAVLKTHMTV